MHVYDKKGKPTYEELAQVALDVFGSFTRNQALVTGDFIDAMWWLGKRLKEAQDSALPDPTVPATEETSQVVGVLNFKACLVCGDTFVTASNHTCRCGNSAKNEDGH